MALTKAKKEKILEDLIEKLKKQKAIFLCDFAGVKVKDLSVLRRKLKEVGNDIKVAKKTLMDIAFKKTNINLETRKMIGEIAIVFSFSDEILPAKILYQFSKENEKLKILGGFSNDKFWSKEEVIELAQLPSREELLAKLVGSVSAPIANFVNVLQANIKGFIYLLANRKQILSE